MTEITPINFNTQKAQTSAIPSSEESIMNTVFSSNAESLEMTGLSVEKTQQIASKRVDKHDKELLANAPKSEITVAGEKKNASIVVDLSENRLYRYDKDGKAFEVYSVASGKKSTPTDTGLRKVSHIETYPYSSAPAGTTRRKSPKAFGPNILILTSIDPKTGKDLGSNGEFIHGNNDPASIGTYASHGCVRMDNDVITELAKQVKPGSYVVIQK